MHTRLVNVLPVEFVEQWRRDRRWVGAIAGTCLVIGLLPAVLARPSFTSEVSFAVQGGEGVPSGLAGLAGQFGVQVASGGGTRSPQFFADLVRSRGVLSAIAADSFGVTADPVRRPLVERLSIDGASPALRLERVIVRLRERLLTVRVSRTTGVVTVGVTTDDPSLSAALAAAVLREMSTASVRLSQAAAAKERRFNAEQLTEARAELAAAEDRVEAFLHSNRQWRESPELSLRHDRLQRELSLRQQLVLSLAQSVAEARMREVRDVPGVVAVDEAYTPVERNPMGRARRLLVTLLLTAVLSICFLIVRVARPGARVHLER